jgi:hypothetical protein
LQQDRRNFTRWDFDSCAEEAAMLLLPAVQAAREAARRTSDGDTLEFTTDTEALSLAGARSAHTAGYWDYDLGSRGFADLGYSEFERLATPHYDEPPVESLSFTFHQIDLF